MRPLHDLCHESICCQCPSVVMWPVFGAPLRTLARSIDRVRDRWAQLFCATHLRAAETIELKHNYTKKQALSSFLFHTSSPAARPTKLALAPRLAVLCAFNWARSSPRASERLSCRNSPNKGAPQPSCSEGRTNDWPGHRSTGESSLDRCRCSASWPWWRRPHRATAGGRP